MSQPEFKSESTPPAEPESGTVQPEVETTAKETPEIEASESGVVMQQPPAPVVSDQTQQQPAPTTSSPTITITVPATAQQLEDWSKGSPDDSLTWIAFFWMRMIKKAIFHGWNIVSGGNALGNA